MSDSHVADELAIRSLVARYAEAVSAHHEENWAATWLYASIEAAGSPRFRYRSPSLSRAFVLLGSTFRCLRYSLRALS